MKRRVSSFTVKAPCELEECRLVSDSIHFDLKPGAELTDEEKDALTQMALLMHNKAFHSHTD